jgi:protein-tyrosine-phosphatase
MAEAFAHMYGGASGGVQRRLPPAASVHPKAIAAMRELVRPHLPPVEGARPPDVEFDVAVTMGCGDRCPGLRAKVREDWDVPCPKEMPPEQFRAVRDLIGEQVKALLARL